MVKSIDTTMKKLCATPNGMNVCCNECTGASANVDLKSLSVTPLRHLLPQHQAPSVIPDRYPSTHRTTSRRATADRVGPFVVRCRAVVVLVAEVKRSSRYSARCSDRNICVSLRCRLREPLKNNSSSFPVKCRNFLKSE